eukprot:Hpha_TRINITY_DN16394_c1_g16::TRINITY_DN16394_c1_g16_i1::g.58976::m.58976
MPIAEDDEDEHMDGQGRQVSTFDKSRFKEEDEDVAPVKVKTEPGESGESRFAEDDEYGEDDGDDGGGDVGGGGGDDEAPARLGGAKKAKRNIERVVRKRAPGQSQKKAAPMTPEEREMMMAEREQKKIENAQRLQRAETREKELMRSGIFFQMRREAVMKEREMREQRRKKLQSREQVSAGTQLAEVDTLALRQERLKTYVRAYYTRLQESAEEGERRVVAEVQVLLPQFNIGFVSVLGDDALLPPELRADEAFLNGKNARRMLVDGSCLVHQALRLGDVVQVDFARHFQGMDMSTEEKRWRSRREAAEDIGWQVTKIVTLSASGIPDRLKLLPAEVRRFMVALLQPLEQGRDLALYARIMQDLELWRWVLMEPYQPTSLTGGLRRWHVLLIISISSRRWLEQSGMYILLWSFFNSFSDSRFLTHTLPQLLQEQYKAPTREERPFCSAVLVQIASFLLLFRQHACIQSEYVANLVKALAGLEGTDHIDPKEVPRFRKLMEQHAGGEPFDTDNYVDMLIDGARKGMNVTKAPSKQEIVQFDEEMVLTMAGGTLLTPEYDLLLSLDEIRTEKALDPESLPRNRVEGAWESSEMYVKSQFDLLRADAYKEFLFSLHQKVHHWEAFRLMDEGGIKRDIDRPSKMFRLVDMLGVSYLHQNLAGRLCYVMRFKLFELIPEQYMHMMLDKGNLVGLTTDRFKEHVWWGVVSHRDQQLLSQGIVGIEFIRGNPNELRNELERLQLIGADRECWMVEAQSLFFTGYRPVLEALKDMGTKAKETGRCPFEEYLVYCRSLPQTPPWVKNNSELFKRQVDRCVEENTFDPSQERAIRALENNFLLVQGPPGTGKSYTGVKMVDVILRTRYAVREQLMKSNIRGRISQRITEAKQLMGEYAGLQDKVDTMRDDILKLKADIAKGGSAHALRAMKVKMVELIQSREEVKGQMRESDERQHECLSHITELEQQWGMVLQQWEEDAGPIQVITYKNHSLDEFLMDVKPSLEDSSEDRTMKDGLVRFGSRSQCEELERYNIRETVRAFESEPNIIAYRKMVNQALRQKTEELKNLGAELSNLESGNPTRECMECSMTEAQKQKFGTVSEASITRWRGKEPNPALVSLQDAARKAEEAEMEKERDSEDDLESEYSDQQRRKEWQNRQLHQTKQEQEQEEMARERFIASFSPILPDAVLPDPQDDPGAEILAQAGDLHDLSPNEREQLVDHWIRLHRRHVQQQYERAKIDYIYLLAAVQELAMQVKVDAVQRAQVIGLTTTGCTINKEILNRVRPSVLIIEEAAEILESQILSCLNASSVQQIVLIGDHKQLRPIVSNYDIAKQCRLDLSLFERMANNNIPVHNLTNQRRMIPEISQFVRPLYRQLVDDDCLKPRKMVCETTGQVRDSGTLPGMGVPVWFWSHEQEEEPSAVGLSVVNMMEVRMAVWLVRYFQARGVGLRQMTVLTPYKGQGRELREALEFAGVHYQGMVCTVDRFQGDENDVMIVSLVRNQRLTEFIKAPDRMCVTLSRARFGMVILGNQSLLEQSRPGSKQQDEQEMAHWTKTMEILRENRWIGDTFPCKCDRHPLKTHDVEVQDVLKGDVGEAKIQSFCSELCRRPYRYCLDQAHHKCHRSCHTGEHEVCPKLCGRLMECGHRCKKMCGECALRGSCVCTQLSEKQPVGCGHYEFSPDLAEAEDNKLPFAWINHLQRRVGCQGEFKPCQRIVYRPRPPPVPNGDKCGHFIRMRCSDQVPAFTNEPCPECLSGMPVADILQRHLDWTQLDAEFCLDIRPEEALIRVERSKSRARSSVGRTRSRAGSQATIGTELPSAAPHARAFSVVTDNFSQFRPVGEGASTYQADDMSMHQVKVEVEDHLDAQSFVAPARDDREGVAEGHASPAPKRPRLATAKAEPVEFDFQDGAESFVVGDPTTTATVKKEEAVDDVKMEVDETS